MGICWLFCVGDQLWLTEVGEPFAAWEPLACLPPADWFDPWLPYGLLCLGPGGYSERVADDWVEGFVRDFDGRDPSSSSSLRLGMRLYACGESSIALSLTGFPLVLTMTM